MANKIEDRLPKCERGTDPSYDQSRTVPALQNEQHYLLHAGFTTSPHLLRHTYIMNLIASGVDPKTVQYLAGHENSKVTMDIYARVKYNKPWELAKVVNAALADPEPKQAS